MVMAQPERRGVRAALPLLAVLALVSSLAACEGLVGIHDSRSLSEVNRDMSSSGGAPPGADGVTGLPSISSADDGEGLDPSEVALNSPEDVSENASPSGTPAPDPSGATDAMAPPNEVPSDAGSDPPPEITPPPVEPTCTPQPPDPRVLEGTVFLFTAGPNGGNPNGLGSCGFPNSALPRAPRFYGAVEPALMKGPASLCGACMRAALGARSVEVTIIDVIEPNPLAKGRTISIDADARKLLADTGQNLDVQFSFVPCGAPDTIRLKFAGPGNPSVLVLGHRNLLRSVRLSTPAAAVDLVRRSYNYWEPPPGFATNGGPVSLTLTDEINQELAVPNLALSPALVDTGVQFPIPGCPDSAR